jgi:hypothetical protein
MIQSLGSRGRFQVPPFGGSLAGKNKTGESELRSPALYGWIPIGYLFFFLAAFFFPAFFATFFFAAFFFAAMFSSPFLLGVD